MVAAYLNKRDISLLTQTSRRLCQLCEHLLYTDLSLDYDSRKTNLFDSYDTTLALARNIQYVKRLNVSVIDIAMLFHSILAYLDATKDLTAGAPQDTRPYWLPSPDSNLLRVVPIPPMINLERLDANLSDRSYYRRSCPNYLVSCESPHTTLLQLCWILYLSPRLTALEAVEPLISNAYEWRVLSESISRLSRLELLELDGIISREEAWGRIGRKFFDSCSSGVRTLTVSMNQSSYITQLVQNHDWNDTEQQQQEQTDLEATPTTPHVLEGLQDFTMWPLREVTSERDLVSVLKHCPNLQRLSLPGIQGQVSGTAIGEALGVHCP